MPLQFASKQIKDAASHKLTSKDIQEHELHLDDKCPGEIHIDTLLAKSGSSKALVLSSSDEYVSHVEQGLDRSKYFTAYWCTHAYNQSTRRKCMMPRNAIRSRQTVGITPSKASNTRKRDRNAVIEQALISASKALMLSSVPKTLPCREQEHGQVRQFMYQQIMSEGQGSGLYMSGMPGTGKTATVRQICKELQAERQRATKSKSRKKKKQKEEEEVLPDFDFFEINAMKLPTPRHIYTELAKKVMGAHFAPRTAVRKLQKHFGEKSEERKVCVLLVDELDYLLTRQQKVIYNLFDWPTMREAKLVVIGIANTMDLPERLLPRVSSRLGTQRVVFKPYTRPQLAQIIEHRLSATKVFSPDAIRFCASAVAGVSGDCRTALQICRRAIEMAQEEMKEHGVAHLLQQTGSTRAKTRKRRKHQVEDEWKEEAVVTLKHLKAAKDSFDQSNDVQVVQTLSIYEKLRFLTSLIG